MTTLEIIQHLPTFIAGSAVLVTLLTTALAINNRRQIAQIRADYARQSAAMDKQLKLVTNGAVGIGQRILALDEKLQQLQNRADAADASDGAIAYNQAMRLFEQGVETDTVATSCGLSVAEASLMSIIHKHKNKAA